MSVCPLSEGECGNLHPILHLTHTSHTSADVVSTSSCHSLSRTPDHPSNASALAQGRLQNSARETKSIVMVAERQFDGAETGDSPVEKVKGSITKLIIRLLEGSSSRASREAYCDEKDLEADIAKHIIEEYAELQKFEAQEATVLIVGGGVDRMTELEHFLLTDEAHKH